jgi:hypothetical protein
LAVLFSTDSVNVGSDLDEEFEIEGDAVASDSRARRRSEARRSARRLK